MYKHIFTPQFIRLTIAHFFYWICFNMFVPIIPRHYHTMGMSDFEIGLIVGAISISGLLFRIPAGKSVNRYGTASVLSLGLLFALIATAGYFFSRSVETAVLCAVIQGAGLACYTCAALTMSSLMFEDKYVVEVFTIFTMAGMAGVSLAMATANWIYDIEGIKYIVIIGLASVTISLITFPKHPVVAAKIKETVGLAMSKIAVKPKVYIPTLSIFVTNVCFSGSMTFLPLLMINRGVNDFNIFFVSFSITVIFFRLITVRLCHSFETRYLEEVSLFTAGIGMLLAAVADGGLLLILCGVFLGISMGIGFPVMGATVTGGVTPVNRSIALSIFTSFSDLGMVAGATGLSIAVGFLGYSSAFLLAGTLSLSYVIFHRLFFLKKLETTPAAQECAKINA